MTAIQRILAATDLSAPARHAVARAFLLARQTGAELTLLHVLDQGGLEALGRLLPGGAAPVEQRLRDAARAALERQAGELTQVHGVSAGLQVVAGRVLTAILDQANSRDASLIVLGAHGEGFLGRLLLGTTAERLLRRTLRPMLVVRQIPRTPYQRVLVPVDFSPWSAAVAQLAAAAAPTGELFLFHAYEAPFEGRLRYAGVEQETLERYLAAARAEALARLQGLIASADLPQARTRLLVEHGEAARLILAQEQELDCDLIVLGKHGQGVLEELLLGSVAKHVLAEAMGDVLVVNLPLGA